MTHGGPATTWWERYWPRRALAASLAVGACYPALYALRPATRRGPVWAAVAFGLFIAVWLLVWADTWRRLVRTRDAESGRVVYDNGVVGWGVPMGFLMAASHATREVGGLSVDHVLSLRFAAGFLAGAFVQGPFALWGGFVFGRVMGALAKLPPRR